MNAVAVETWGIVNLIATHEVTVRGAIIVIKVGIILFAVIAPCNTIVAIATWETIVLVTITQSALLTIVICEMVVAGQCIVALVLAVVGPISVIIPMPWWIPILDKSLMTTFWPSQGPLFFLYTLQIQGSSSAFKLILLRTTSTIALAFILTKIYTLVCRRLLHPV
jgi:hypothetical protein